MSAPTYMGLTPAETLEQYPLLTMTQTAWVLQELFLKGAKKGEPDRRKVLDLMAKGKLHPISADGPSAHWKVSAAEVRRYLEGPKPGVQPGRIMVPPGTVVL